MKEFDFSKASDTVVKLMKERGGIPTGELTMFYCSTPSIRFKSGATIKYKELILDQDVYKGECSEMYSLREVYKDGEVIGYKGRHVLA